MKIGAISLGCDKNRVDTEKMLARLTSGGHTLVGTEDDADIIIINTCAFIDSAKEESIDEILRAIASKTEYGNKKIIVTGCLAQRYSEQLKEEFPEVDALLGVHDYDEILQTVNSVAAGNKIVGGGDKCLFYADRVLTTPYHYAYLKIADGCDNHCTYCAIPFIRGKYRSERMEDLLAEARKLRDDGVKELILVAQDVTRYGMDFDGRSHLKELVIELEKVGFEWIRLLYLEPEMVDDSLIEFVANEPQVVKYMDIPLQHVDSEILKRMGRHTDRRSTIELIRKVKAMGITVRTTFICGFPGESERAYKELEDFVREERPDYAGFFAYSREEGTAADRLHGHLPEEVKLKRTENLRKLQAQIIEERHRAMVGSVVQAIYEDIDYDRQMFVGRCAAQAPDIDSVIYFTSERPVDIGSFYSVEIVGVDGIDLLGRVKQ